jgi:hypothetical protein
MHIVLSQWAGEDTDLICRGDLIRGPSFPETGSL